MSNSKERRDHGRRVGGTAGAGVPAVAKEPA